MTYTRKARRHSRPSATRKHHLPMHASTMKGIHHWHTRMFEKLGWMVLAKEKGYGYKVDAYKKSLDHLVKTIDHVSAEYENRNRKHDLRVLRMNVVCLQEFVKKHL